MTWRGKSVRFAQYSLGRGGRMTPRTHTCGALRAEHAGQTVTLHGWVSGLRDKKTIFVVLRDRYGTVQVTLDEQCPED